MLPHQWAVEIVRSLQLAGFQSLWAGGCVRDGLLGIEPKDYDVATSATPDEVQQVFGLKRTLSIGKSFGVITVIGPVSAGHIEVATFRRDGGYSDGRHPDSIEFTDAKEDALRRDFTINGMFFDPLAEKVIDYVGGKRDLENRLIRAIGDAEARIEEDKLRMLRGVRFAATYGFKIEPQTMEAIQKKASEIDVVSAERIGAEMRRMLDHSSKSRAMRLLIDSNLWGQVTPSELSGSCDWNVKIRLLDKLDAGFTTTLAVLLRETGFSAARLQERWRLKNDEVARVDWILANEESLSKASILKWSQLQPLLISPHAKSAIDLLQAVLDSGEGTEELEASISCCREKLLLEKDVLNPSPLLRGNDLADLGLQPGPQFKSVLESVRIMQLDGELQSPDDARTWISDSLL